jgi:hypothetical protein
VARWRCGEPEFASPITMMMMTTNKFRVYDLRLRVTYSMGGVRGERTIIGVLLSVFPEERGPRREGSEERGQSSVCSYRYRYAAHTPTHPHTRTQEHTRPHPPTHTPRVRCIPFQRESGTHTHTHTHTQTHTNIHTAHPLYSISGTN